MTRFWRSRRSRHSWLLALALAGCVPDRDAPPPAHEFLVAAGDSTFWVRGEPAGIRVRGSPLLLARLRGRFHELYVTDDDRSYFQAVLIGQRLWRRDLVTGDSLLVFEDSLVPALARSYARAHPDAVPLDPEQDASDDPEAYASAEVEIIDVHGPFLSYEYHADVETRDGDESHLTHHGVIDLERAERATLASIYGAEAARSLEREGRRRFTAAMDSILRARRPLERNATEALAGFTFDPRSFTLLELNGESAVAFAIPGHGPHAGGLMLDLDPIPAGAPAWWKVIQPTLPSAGESALVYRWSRARYEVLARYAADRDAALLAMRAPRRETSGESSRDTLREWRIATVPVPVFRIEWLDEPPIDSIDRRALARAFDAAALYDESTRIVREGAHHSGVILASAPGAPPRTGRRQRAAASRDPRRAGSASVPSTPRRHQSR